MNSDSSIRSDTGRVFVVGCARSGTTLLQSMLAAHPRVLGFPETFFFVNAGVRPAQLRERQTLRTRRRVRYALQDARERLNLSAWHLRLYDFVDIQKGARAFLRTLDGLARHEHKAVWVEKTPGHIHWIDIISALCPEAKFIHVLRDGRDVVASLEDVYRQRKSATASGRPIGAWDLNEAINQWNECIRISHQHATHSRHHRVQYSALLCEPEATMCGLCEALGLEFDASVLDHQRASRRVLGRDIGDKWRTDVSGPLKDTHLVKYDRLFSQHEKAEIESALLGGGELSLALRAVAQD